MAQGGPSTELTSSVVIDAAGTAQPNPDIQVSEKPINSQDAAATSAKAVAAFDNVIQVANNAINSIRSGGGLAKYGEYLTLMLTAIVMSWAILKNLLLKLSFQQLFGDFIFPLVIAGFVLSAGLQKLPAAIESSTNAIASRFTPGASTDSAEKKVAGSMIKSAIRVWNSDDKSAFASIFSAPLELVLKALFRVIVVLLIFTAAALAVAALLVAKFQIALAIGLAPLLIPWIVFKPTEFLFSGWLSFLLKAGFGLVGVLAVASVVSAGAKGMENLLDKVPTGTEGILTYAAMAGMAVIFTYLMLKASDIGEGVISGSAQGVGGISAVAKGSAVMAPVALAGSAVGAAGSAARLGAAAAAGRLARGTSKDSGAAAVAKAFTAGRSPLANAAFNAARGAAPSGSSTTASQSGASQPPAFRKLAGSGAKIKS